MRVSTAFVDENQIWLDFHDLILYALQSQLSEPSMKFQMDRVNSSELIVFPETAEGFVDEVSLFQTKRACNLPISYILFFAIGCCHDIVSLPVIGQWIRLSSSMALHGTEGNCTAACIARKHS